MHNINRPISLPCTINNGYTVYVNEHEVAHGPSHGWLEGERCQPEDGIPNSVARDIFERVREYSPSQVRVNYNGRDYTFTQIAVTAGTFSGNMHRIFSGDFGELARRIENMRSQIRDGVSNTGRSIERVGYGILEGVRRFLP